MRGILRVEDRQVTNQDHEYADKMGRVLKSRLQKHIQSKIADPTKHNHPALLFVHANLNRFVALLWLFGQARRSPVMNPNSCLLAQPSVGGFLLAVDSALEGSYLHYSTEDGH